MKIRHKVDLPSSENRSPTEYLNDLLRKNATIIDPPFLKSRDRKPIPGDLYIAFIKIEKKSGRYPSFIDSFKNNDFFRIQEMPKQICK